MSREIQRLRELARELCLPHETAAVDGDGVLHVLPEGPLLTALDNLVGSKSSAAGGRGHKLPSERSMVNEEALTVYRYISDDIVKHWQLMAGRRRPLDRSLCEKLLDIVAILASSCPNAAEVEAWCEQLEDWVSTIRRRIDHEATFEVLGACPDCGATHALLDGLGGRGRALVVTYPRAHVSLAALSCRACGVELASGVPAVRLAAETFGLASDVAANDEETVS